jgi:pyruvate kinase
MKEINNMRKTKIVATLGPATNEVPIIKELIKAGLNAARFNFSHGSYEEHGQRMDNFIKAREEMGAPLPMVLDTKGPEIRTGQFENGFIMIEAGDKFTLTTDDITGTQEKVSITYKDLPKDLVKGSTVLIDDGLIELKVDEIVGNDIHCTAMNGGKIGSKKGVNVPDVHINLPALTEKDINDIKFGITKGVDYIAASFIRSASDVLEIKKVLEENGGSDIKIISKIESRDGVNNIDQILEVTDAIMVARGDLGVEIPFEEVPIIQKRLIKKCREKSKTVITATQMLDSMQSNPRPTRAEVSDVANAVYDRTDAIMLSGESAQGKYPVESVKAMDKIAREVESSFDYIKKFDENRTVLLPNIASAVSHSACTTAHDLGANLIAVVSMSGRAVNMVAKYRPACTILACTPNERTLRQLSLVWGAIPMSVTYREENFHQLFEDVCEESNRIGLTQVGDIVVFTGGTPLGSKGATNTLKVGVVGRKVIEANSRNTAAKDVTARTLIINTKDELELKFQKNMVLVTADNDEALVPYVKQSAALILGSGKNDSFKALIDAAKDADIPVLVSDKNVEETIPDNLLVKVDSGKGIVYNCNN